MASLDSLVSIFFSNFFNPIKLQINYLIHLRSNVQKLREAMKELEDRRKDVYQLIQLSERQQENPKHEVQGWLESVKTMHNEVAALLNDYEGRSKCFGGSCPVNCLSGYRIGRRAFKKHAAVVELKNKGAFAEGVGNRALPTDVIEKPTPATVGVDSMVSNIVRYLREDDIGIIGIYGMGGVGKTTILKKINNEFLEERLAKEFDYVIWVVVSKDRTVTELQKVILKRLGLASTGDDQADEIFQFFSKKKFLLFLDDIWKPLALETLGIPIPRRGDNRKHKIVFTTRFENVCAGMDAHKRMKVECLQWKEAWKLFREKVGEETINLHRQIRNLAKEVARECGGLPLALITIGRAMSTRKTPQEWKYALATLKKSQPDIAGMEDELYCLLKFSYDSLQSEITRKFFLNCALFPEDFDIQKDELIEYWIGLGLFDEFNDINEAFNKGYDIIGILLSACLLETNDRYPVATVKMHDVHRDMALWITNECGKKRNKSIVLARVGLQEAPDSITWGETELLSLSRNYELKIILSRFFEYMPTLQYLDLSCTCITHLPRGIGMLVELQYLNLSCSNIQVLPTQLGDLQKLKYLGLEDTRELINIPSGLISKLSKLHQLRLFGSRFVKWKVEGNTDPGENGIELNELESLKMLKSLSINVNGFYALQWLLESQLPLEKLCIQDFRDCSTLWLPSTIPWSIKTRRRLYQLRLWGISSRELVFGSPDWNLQALTYLLIEYCWKLTSIICKKVRPSVCFPNLQRVTLRSCHNLKNASWVLQLPQLEKLCVESCNRLEYVVDEETCKEVESGITPAFCSLFYLDLNSLPKLKSICGDVLAFPSLMSLTVRDCSQLRRLPAGIISVHGQIKKMYGEEEWFKALEWKEGEESARSSLLSVFKRV